MVSAATDTGYVFPDPAGQSFVRLLAAVMLLAPAVCVLGARRPGAAAWPWFVVLPLVVVLMWPAISQLVHLRNRQSLELSLPAFAAVLLVLLMSYGNYFGTAQTTAAFQLGASVVLLLLPFAPWGPRASWLPAAAAMLIAVSSSLAIRRLNSLSNWRTASVGESADRIWLQFRDSYGLVWATRVVLRVNQFAERERWDVELTLDGFRPVVDGGRDSQPRNNPADGRHPLATPASCLTASCVAESALTASCLTESQLRRPLEVLCWVLKRFASPEWLQEQLGRWSPGSFGAPGDRRREDEG